MMNDDEYINGSLWLITTFSPNFLPVLEVWEGKTATLIILKPLM